MAEQRFRFRFPWQAASRPSQATQEPPSTAGQTQPAAKAQRRPLRPGGSAQPPTRQSPARVEPPPVSPSTTQKGSPSRTTSRSASKRRITPPPEEPITSPSRAVPQTQSPSPLRGDIQQARSTAAATTPSTTRSSDIEFEQEVNPISTPKKQSPTTEIAEHKKEQREQNNSLPSSQNPQSMNSSLQDEVLALGETKLTQSHVSVPEPEPKQEPKEVYEASSKDSVEMSSITEIAEHKKEQKEHKKSLPSSQKPQSMNSIQDEVLALEETKLPQSHVPVPQPEPKQEPKEVYEASSKYSVEILKGMNYEEPKKNAVSHERGQGSKGTIKGHSFAKLNDFGQHPREDVFHQKEISNDHNTKKEHFGYEHSKFNHNHEINGDRASLDKENKEKLPKIIHRLGATRDKDKLDETPFSITTLTGENTGAIMHLSTEPAKRERPIHIHRGYKAMPEEGVDTVADNERSSRGRKSANTKVEEDAGKKLYVNNNTQGINNSLVFSSSVTEKNPGAHLVLSYKVAEPVKTGKEVGTHETQKAEVSSTAAKRLTYVPDIRRRCLRGLFLEPSDSDPENSEKPRRHGCQAECSQRSKDDLH